ncbi:MAG: DUF5103 domain-containing protein [Chitinophagaceae bacterium]|nr:DUF5103 domain-containing protein [Chitinophagaceae bacterium]MCW5905895.1 DUF5103 domain-containing protein [Chitinophagaceae bacterium]
MKYLLLIFCSLTIINANAQQIGKDSIYMDNIHTVQLYKQNDQMSLPIINLGSSDLIELHFDDLDGYVKRYSYSFQLCNENWEEVNLSPFDYIKGFTQNNLNQYRVSSIALTKYVHYQAILPDRGSIPIKSGNYVLKVFLNGDIRQIAFTKRFFVVDNRATIGAQILQSFDNSLFKTHQKVQVSVNVAQLNPINPQQQVKIVIMQNNRWDNVVRDIMPVFIRGNILEYNGEQDCLFAAGKEYRWADLRSFRLATERVESIDKSVQPNEIILRPDFAKTSLRYTYFRDYNGWYFINTTENINPFWQGDYANVQFAFIPEGKKEYTEKDVYIIGNFINGGLSDSAKMEYDEVEGAYLKSFLLKQGYYSYTYVTKDKHNINAKADFAQTEGNFWETENDYTIFVYYRSYSGRHDELVGITNINSRAFRR